MFFYCLIAKHILFFHYYLHRPLCKDQAFRSQGKADWEEEENFCQDGEFESLLQRVFCLPCGAGTTKGKIRTLLYFITPTLKCFCILKEVSLLKGT